MLSKTFIKITKEFKNKNRQAIVEPEENDSTANADFDHNSDESSSSTVEQKLITTQSTFDILIIESISLTDHHADLEFTNLQQKQICNMIRNIMHIKLQLMINNIFDSIVQAIFVQTRTQIPASTSSTSSFVDSSFDLSNIESESYNSSIKSLSTDQVSYFDSEYKKEEDKTTLFSSSIESMMTTDKYVYYKNVYVFVDRLKNLVSQHEHSQIRNVLKSCLRDDAQIWHIYELSDTTKNLLRETSLSQ